MSPSSSSTSVSSRLSSLRIPVSLQTRLNTPYSKPAYITPLASHPPQKPNNAPTTTQPPRTPSPSPISIRVHTYHHITFPFREAGPGTIPERISFSTFGHLAGRLAGVGLAFGVGLLNMIYPSTNPHFLYKNSTKIGRASCRERVSRLV